MVLLELKLLNIDTCLCEVVDPEPSPLSLQEVLHVQVELSLARMVLWLLSAEKLDVSCLQ